MEPHFVEIKDFKTQASIIVEMEEPYHPKPTRVGEHIYGITLIIDGIPYHFKKYIFPREEIEKFQEENEGKPQFQKAATFTASCHLSNKFDCYDLHGINGHIPRPNDKNK